VKTRNIVTVLAVAAATAALTIVVLSPWTGSSAQAGPAVKPTIVQPELVSKGCKFVLKTDKESYEGDEHPVVEVTASNPTKETVNASVWVLVTATSPVSARSRMMPMPQTLWTQEYAFSLAPDETKTQRFTCNLTGQSGQSSMAQNVRIILSDNKNAILANQLDVPGVPPGGGPNQVPPKAPPARK
jgi:hypothetical protein